MECAADVAEYESGAFYRRELPLILALLEGLDVVPSTIVVDGYVYLDAQDRPGLGAHLYAALAEKIPVIGVAKRPFAGSAHAVAITRGTSERPLYVTAAGAPPERAAVWIASMSGAHRQPTLLKAADRLSRGD